MPATQSPFAMNPNPQAPKKKKPATAVTTPPAPSFDFGASASPQPGFGFGTTTPTLPQPQAAPAGAQPPLADPFSAMIMQLMNKGPAAPQAGPDLGALIHQLREPRQSPDITNAYNIGSQLPSGAGSQFNPFNNPNMFGTANASGVPRKPVAAPPLKNPFL